MSQNIVWVNLSYLFAHTGSEHQELQISEMAVLVKLQQPASPPTDRDSSSEQPDGAVVSHALLDATFVPVSQGLQRVVFQPTVWDDRGKQRIQ